LYVKKYWIAILFYYHYILLVLQCWGLKTQSSLKDGFYEVHQFYWLIFLFSNILFLCFLKPLGTIKISKPLHLTIDAEFRIQI